MADLYDTGLLDNSTSIYDSVKYINQLSDGLLAGVLLISIWIMLIMVFRSRGEFKDVMLGVSFIVVFLASLLLALQLITVAIFILPFILLLASIIIKIWGA
jgi:hypothetical protein